MDSNIYAYIFEYLGYVPRVCKLFITLIKQDSDQGRIYERIRHFGYDPALIKRYHTHDSLCAIEAQAAADLYRSHLLKSPFNYVRSFNYYFKLNYRILPGTVIGTVINAPSWSLDQLLVSSELVKLAQNISHCVVLDDWYQHPDFHVIAFTIVLRLGLTRERILRTMVFHLSNIRNQGRELALDDRVKHPLYQVAYHMAFDYDPMNVASVITNHKLAPADAGKLFSSYINAGYMINSYRNDYYAHSDLNIDFCILLDDLKIAPEHIHLDTAPMMEFVYWLIETRPTIVVLHYVSKIPKLQLRAVHVHLMYHKHGANAVHWAIAKKLVFDADYALTVANGTNADLIVGNEIYKHFGNKEPDALITAFHQPAFRTACGLNKMIGFMFATNLKQHSIVMTQMLRAVFGHNNYVTVAIIDVLLDRGSKTQNEGVAHIIKELSSIQKHIFIQSIPYLSDDMVM